MRAFEKSRKMLGHIKKLNVNEIPINQYADLKIRRIRHKQDIALNEHEV